MAFSDIDFSEKQRSLLQREQSILSAAESILVSDGFFDMSMVRIARKSNCTRAVVYLHFASREDIVVALAGRAWEKRLELLQRAASYPGPARIRMAAVAEGFAIFYRCYPEQFAILHKTTEAICEKASPHRLERLRRAEQATGNLLRALVEEAVRLGDLPSHDFDVEELVFALSALATGGFFLHELGFTRVTLQAPDAMDKFWRALNTLADAYQWRPLSADVDWEETLADIRRTLFPEEVQKIYGPEAWYGQWGVHHPKDWRSHAPVSGPHSAGSRSFKTDSVP